jgi:hypothetical protein
LDGARGELLCLFLGWEEGKSIDGDGKSVDERLISLNFSKKINSISNRFKKNLKPSSTCFSLALK